MINITAKDVVKSVKDEFINYIHSDSYLDAPTEESCKIAIKALELIIEERRCSEIV